MIAIDLCGTNPKWGEKLVKDMNVKLMIFKGGYSFNTSTVNRDDSQIWNNIKKAEKFGLPYGIYVYSYAEDKVDALKEAQHAIDIYNKACYKPKMIFIDVEELDIAQKLGKSKMTEIVKVFCEEVEKKTNAIPGYYCSTSYFKNYIDIPISNNRLRWLAQWSSTAPKFDYHIWQNQSVNDEYGDIDINYVPDSGRVADIIKKEEKPVTPTVPEVTPDTPKDEVDKIVDEVIDGNFGNGFERKNALEEMYGRNAYYVVQARLNRYIILANAVREGNYGNGRKRSEKLLKYGYSPIIIQKIINKSIY